MILPARMIYRVIKLPEKMLKTRSAFDVYFDKMWYKK